RRDGVVAGGPPESQEAPPVKPQEGSDAAPAAAGFTLASASSTPMDLRPAQDGQISIPPETTSPSKDAVADTGPQTQPAPDANAVATRAVPAAPAGGDRRTVADDDAPRAEDARTSFAIAP